MRRYGSKQDLWITILLWGGLGAGAWALLFTAEGDVPSLPVRLLLAGSIFVVPAALVYPLYYEVRASDLRVRCGLVRYTILGSEIESVTPSRNPVSSPAMSLDRLAIRYRRSGRERLLLISPAERAEFLQDLVGITPHLWYDGDQLVPKPAAVHA
jgi:hypothetical protein